MKDLQVHALLSGYWAALFERQRTVSFPKEMVDDIYRDKSPAEVSKDTQEWFNQVKKDFLEGRKSQDAE